MLLAAVSLKHPGTLELHNMLLSFGLNFCYSRILNAPTYQNSFDRHLFNSNNPCLRMVSDHSISCNSIQQQLSVNLRRASAALDPLAPLQLFTTLSLQLRLSTNPQRSFVSSGIICDEPVLHFIYPLNSTCPRICIESITQFIGSRSFQLQQSMTAHDLKTFHLM